MWIPGVYPDSLQSDPDALPDAEQITPLFGGSNKGNGVFSYPNIGSVVLCGFYNEDQNYPFLFGSILGGENPQSEYSEVRSDTTDKSVKNGDDARVHKISVDQTTVKMWESGHIEVRTVYDRTNKPAKYSTIDIDGDGNVNIVSTTQIHLESPDIMIDTQSMTVNAQSIKVNVGRGAELKTSTLNVKADSEIDVTAPTKIEVLSKSNNVISPVINIDAINAAKKFGGSGSIAIKSMNHPPIFL